MVRFIKKLFYKFVMYLLVTYINFFEWNIQRINSPKISSLTSERLKRILIVRLDEIGDIVLMSSFFRELRKNNPNAEITVVVKKETLPLMEICPYINKVFGVSFSKGRFSSFLGIIQAINFCKKKLCQNIVNGYVYDMAIVPRWDTDYGYFAGYIALFAMAKYRIAYAACVNRTKEKFDSVYDKFYTHLLTETHHIHEVKRNLDLLSFIGYKVECDNLELWTSKEDNDFIAHYFDDTKKTVIALFLSAGSERREWPVSKFANVACILQEKYANLSIFILGAGSHAQELGDVMMRKSAGVVNLINKLTLRQTASFLKRATIACGGDTGPLHMAAAAGCSCVVLSCHPLGADVNHANSPARFGVWHANSITLRPRALPGCEDGCCKNYTHCIDNISVGEVVKSIEEFLM